IISLLREYDLKSKGIGNSSTPDGDLMREMIYKIMH
ncbi:MAG: DNA polymerase III subunit delta, partial [Bacteroidales bacterium]|nr:DNA polymerase III subunit delta [Bacteroidales bacterium]